MSSSIPSLLRSVGFLLFCFVMFVIRPMDLQQMEERLDSGQYMTFTDFRNDFKLIVNNCRLYNGQNNGESKIHCVRVCVLSRRNHLKNKFDL